ncbi:Protein of unknown function [Gryllus bimaculatus]|nr:Protein of unknown function [Gryllus bimaculatus]
MTEERCKEMDIIVNEDLSFRSAEDNSLFLTKNENNMPHLDDSTSEKNLGREWGEDILRSFAALDHENIEKFGKGNDSLIRFKDSIPCARSSALPSNKSALVLTSIRPRKATPKTISIMQGRQKNRASILVTKKIKIALKRLRRTTEKTRSLRFFKHKQSIRTNNAHVPVHLEKTVKIRDSWSNSKIKEDGSEIEEFSRNEEMSGNLCNDSDMKLNQSQRTRGDTESLDKCKEKNHVNSGLAYSFLTEASDTKGHSGDANQSFSKSDQEIKYAFGNMKSKLPVKSLPTDVSLETPKNVKTNDSNAILTFSVDKSRVSPGGERSKFSHSQKLLRQSKLFLMKRSARFSQKSLSHSTFSAGKELFPNVEKEECLKRRCDASPSSTQKIKTKCETELDPVATIIAQELNENPSNGLLVEANTKTEKLREVQQKQYPESNLQEVIEDVNTFVEDVNILRPCSKAERVKTSKCGEIPSELVKPSNSALPSVSEVSPASRRSTCKTSSKISQNSPYLKKAKPNQRQSLRERKAHKKPSDDCNANCDKSADSSSGIIRKTEENLACEEIYNVTRTKSSATECSEDKRKEPCSYKNERSCRYFLRKKRPTNTKSETLVTSKATNSKTGVNAHASQVHEMKDDLSSRRIENQNEKQEVFGSETPKSNFSTKKFTQNSFLPNDSAQQKECKNTVISMNLEEKSKKKNIRKRKLWFQSPSFEDIEEQEINKTSCSSLSHEGTCRSHVNNYFQNATNNFGTLQDVDSEKEGNVDKKCNLQHESNWSHKEIGDYTHSQNIRDKITLLLQKQDANKIRCVASEEASPTETSTKIQKLHINQHITNAKDCAQENSLSLRQYLDGRNSSISPRIYSENETVEVCLSKEKEILKETHKISAIREDDNQTSYSDETTSLLFGIQKGNEKEVLNSHGEPNIEQITPTTIASPGDTSPHLLRSISVRPKRIKKNSHLDSSIVNAINGSTSDNPEHFKNSHDRLIQFSGVELNSEVQNTLQENIKDTEGVSSDTVNRVRKNSNNYINKEKLLKTQTNMVVKDARSSLLKENWHEKHDGSQKAGPCSFDMGMITHSHCVPVFPLRTLRNKTLMAKQLSLIQNTNFKIAGEINMPQTALNSKSDCEFLNDPGENRELLDLNAIGFATNTDGSEPIMCLDKLPVYPGSITIKNVQEINESHTDLVHNSLTGSNDENLLIPDTEHDSEENEKFKNSLLMASRTVSRLPTESTNKCEEQINNRDPAHSLRSNASEAGGILNRVSDSRNNGELPMESCLYRPEGTENVTHTSLPDSTKDIANTKHESSLIVSDPISMSTHNKSKLECLTREKIHNALGNSLDSYKKNKYHSEMISVSSELLENWKHELKVKRSLFFQQNSPGVATCDNKITLTSSSDMVTPQDDGYEDLRIPVGEQHKEGVLDSFIHILTKNGDKIYVITCVSPENKKHTKKDNGQDLQENASDSSGKEKMAMVPLTSPFKCNVSNRENKEKLMENQNSEKACSGTSKVNEETENIDHQHDLFFIHDKKSAEPDRSASCVKMKGTEYDRIIPSKGKFESPIEVRQVGKLTSCKCDRDNTYIQKELRTSAKAVRNKKVVVKSSRSPYMLRNAKLEENHLSLQSKKKRQCNNKPAAKQSGLYVQDNSLQKLSHPSFLLAEITRMARSPYLLRNRKIRSQLSFHNHSKQMRTVREVTTHSVKKSCIKSGSNSYGLEDDNRKKRSPYKLRNNARRKSCNNSNTKNKRKTHTGNKRKSPTSRVKQGHLVSTILSTLAMISRSPHLSMLERKTFQRAKKRFHISSKRKKVVRASTEKIQDDVGIQIASGVPVPTSAADSCISISKEDEREFEKEGKLSTTSVYSDLECQILPESPEHKTSTHDFSEVEKYPTFVTERMEDKTLSSHLPCNVDTMKSKGEETLRESHSFAMAGQRENRENELNELNSDISTHPKIAIEPEQIPSEAIALDKNLFETSFEYETTFENFLPQIPILVDQNSEAAEKDHSSPHERKENIDSSTKKHTPLDTNIYCSYSENCEENIEISEVNKCITSIMKKYKNSPNWGENKHEEIPLSSTFPRQTQNCTFLKKKEQSIQFLSSPFLQQFTADKRNFPCKSSIKAQKKKRMNTNLRLVTNAYANVALHSEEGSSGSNSLEENNPHLSVLSQGRNKSSFEGSCWLNDEIRKLFPLPQCLDESNNRIMSSSTFIWLCSEKKSRESRFPLLKKTKKTKSKKISEKQRGWALSNNILSHSVSVTGRKKFKPTIIEKKCEENNKKQLCSKHLTSQIKNRVNARKLVTNNEKSNALRTLQEHQNPRGIANSEFRPVVNKRISFKSREHLLSSAKSNYVFPKSDAGKKTQKLLHSPADEGRHVSRILSCSQTSKLESFKPMCQEEVMKQDQHSAQLASVKVKNLKILKHIQKAESKLMVKASANSNAQALINKHHEKSGKISEALQKSFEFEIKRKSKKAGMSRPRVHSGYTRSTSSITNVADSNLLPGNATNKGSKSGIPVLYLKPEVTEVKHSEKFQNTDVHKREAVECKASKTDRDQDAIKFLKHMYSISYSAAKMKSRKHISSSHILTRLINDSKLQAKRRKINNGTSTAGKLTSELPTKKALTTRKQNDMTTPMTDGYEDVKLNVLRSFALREDYNNENASQSSIPKASKKINRSLGNRGTSTTQERKRKRLSSFPSHTRNSMLKRKQPTGSGKLQDQESSYEDTGVTHAKQTSHATSQPPTEFSCTKDARSGSLSSSNVPPQGKGTIVHMFTTPGNSCKEWITEN